MKELHEGTDTTIIARLKEEQPGINLVHAALRTLTEPEDINKFTYEYAFELSFSDNEEIRDKSYTTALRDIGYTMHQYDSETITRWKSAVEHLDHPFVNGASTSNN